MSYELKQYSFGQTIGKGFNLYFDNFIPIALLSLICQIPMLLYAYYQKTMIFDTTHQFGSFLAGVVTMGINVTLEAVLSAFIVYLVAKKYLEGSLDMSRCQPAQKTSFFSLILPVIGLALLVGLLTGVGFMACIIPGVIVSLGLCVSTEVLVVEGRGVSESISRSWNLTKGRRGDIFGLLFISGLILCGLVFPVMIILGLLNLEPLLSEYLRILITAMITPFQACIIVVIYFNLRIEKEGFNIEHLVQQFSIPEGTGNSVEM